MATNNSLHIARAAKKDEFYTQYDDIKKEVENYVEYNPDVFRNKIILLPCDDPEWSNFTKYFAENFERFGIKKLISTSFAGSLSNKTISKFERNYKGYNSQKHDSCGKIFILDKDINNSGTIDFNDIQFHYLQGDGDFRSKEVTRLRDEADIIITNPPFSLFREFFKWITEANKQFLIIGNVNSITYKEVFREIKNNKVWLGTGLGRWISGFIVPDFYELYGTEARLSESGQRIIATNNALWLTNLDHNKRQNMMKLHSMADNLKNNTKVIRRLKNKYNSITYPKYDNYDAIEIPYTDAIPSDYQGAMGVPITFLDRYNPKQFEIIRFRKGNDDKDLSINGKNPYFRIIIKAKQE